MDRAGVSRAGSPLSAGLRGARGCTGRLPRQQLEDRPAGVGCSRATGSVSERHRREDRVTDSSGAVAIDGVRQGTTITPRGRVVEHPHDRPDGGGAAACVPRDPWSVDRAHAGTGSADRRRRHPPRRRGDPRRWLPARAQRGIMNTRPVVLGGGVLGVLHEVIPRHSSTHRSRRSPSGGRGSSSGASSSRCSAVRAVGSWPSHTWRRSTGAPGPGCPTSGRRSTAPSGPAGRRRHALRRRSVHQRERSRAGGGTHGSRSGHGRGAIRVACHARPQQRDDPPLRPHARRRRADPRRRRSVRPHHRAVGGDGDGGQPRSRDPRDRSAGHRLRAGINGQVYDVDVSALARTPPASSPS